MDQIVFKNIETARTITLDTSLYRVLANGREVYIQDQAVWALLIELFSIKSPLVNFDEIGNLVRSKKSSHHMADSSNSILANKYIFKVREALKKAMVENIILTVRGLGYHVSRKWLPVFEQSANQSTENVFLYEVRAIIKDCIAYSESVKVTQDKSGLCFIKPDEETAIEYFKRVSHCYYRFLKSYSALGNAIWLIDIKEKLAKILLYATYWRVGDSLTDEKFRSDYKNELNLFLKRLEQGMVLMVAQKEKFKDLN